MKGNSIKQKDTEVVRVDVEVYWLLRREAQARDVSLNTILRERLGLPAKVKP